MASVALLASVLTAIGLPATTAFGDDPPTATLLVRLDPSLTAAEQDAVIAAHGGTETSVVAPLGLHEVLVDAASANAALAGYSADPWVLSASADVSRQVTGAATDPGYPSQWALPKIGWEAVHGEATFAGEVTLAVLDTGVDAATPDLAGRLESGWSFDGSDPGTDANGHGTHTATIAAASADDGVGIAGVAYANTTVMPVKVLASDGSGTDADIIAGLVWATDHGADVAVMPFSNPGYSSALQAAIDYAWANGVVLIAAAGNDGSTDPSYPAGSAKVVGVGGTASDDMLSGSTNRSTAVFISAPGVDVLALDASGTVSVNGTSASAAITAGSAAVLRAIDPGASNATIVGRLARWADPLNESYLGNGRVNLANASLDTSPDGVTPVGAPGGGPFVGPYLVAIARTWTGVGSTNFNNGGNWSPAGTPTALDALTIPGGVASGNYPLISTGTGNGLAASIVVNSGASLTVTGSSLNVSGLLTNNGTLTLSSTASISVANNLASNGTFAISGTSTLTIPHDFLGTGTTTMTGGTVLIGRNWRPTGGSFTATNGTVEFTGPADSSANFAAAPNQFYNVVVDAGADPRFQQAAGSLIKIRNSFTNSNPTLNVGTNATFVFNGTGNQAVSSASTNATFGHLVVDKPSNGVVLGSDAKVAGNTTVASGELLMGAFSVDRTAPGGTFAAADGTLVEVGDAAFPANYATISLAPTNEVSYDGTTQSVAAATYGYLELTNTGMKTLPAGAVNVVNDFAVRMSAKATLVGPVTVDGNMSMSPGSQTFAGSSTHHLRGNLANQSIGFFSQTSTFVFDGSSTQTVTGLIGSAFYNLTLDNPAGMQLTVNIQVAGSPGLVLLDGNITTGVNSVIINATGAVVRTSGHVVGNLRKQINTNGTLLRTFEVGTSAGYAPLDLEIRGVSGAGAGGFQFLSVTTTPGEHADVTASGVDPSQNVNVYWTVSGGGTWTFTDYDATYSFPAAEIDAGADTSTFIVRRKTAGSWFAAATGVRTPTSTQSLGNTSFSDFVVGEPSGDATTTTIACPTNLVYGSGGLCTATVTTSIPGVPPSGTVTFSTDGSGTFTPSASCTVVPVSTDASTCSATYTPTAVGTGTHAVSASFNDGVAYLPSISAPASIAVDPALLTITADDLMKVYGDADPTFTFTYSGLVNGDLATATPPTCSVSGAHDDVVGSPYPITCSGAVDPNYTISYVDGELEVTPAALTITADDQIKAAGEPDPAFTFTYAGLTNGDVATDTPPTCTVVGPHDTASGSPYPITCSGAVDPNYSISYVDGELVVYDPVPPVVMAIDRADANPTNAASVQWNVTFSEDVTGVDIGDFDLSGTGTLGASVVSVSADTGPTRTVTASTGVSGSLALDLSDDDSIEDLDGTPLAGVGVGNGDFAGQAYTVDKDGPLITITTPPNGASYTLGQVVNASYTCADGSGVATCTGTVADGAAISTSPVGAKTFTVDATDSLGNPATLTNSYNVVYAFTGFFPPVDNLPVLNSVKAGQAIPVKFSLGGNQGLSIFLAGYPKSEVIACDSTALVDGIEETVNAGGSSLSYDPVTDQYNYVWKTLKTYPVGSCRQLVLKFVDGTTARANFKFK